MRQYGDSLRCQFMLQIAAFLIIALGVAHSFLGERYLISRLLRRPDLPRLFGSTTFTAQTLRFAWHITTVAWFGFAAMVFAAGHAQLSSRSAVQIIGWTALASGILPLVFTRGRHLSWIVLFVIAAIALTAGAR